MFRAVGNDRYRDYAGDIHSSGAHLLSLINDLLDVAKIEAGRMDIAPHPLEAARTFDIALKLVGSKAREKDQALVIAVDENAPPLWADERAVKQILINLVSNAVKFTPQGGRIDVIASRAAGGDFQIMVRDNGPGIPREKLDNIFEPFSQVDNRFDRQAGGTGLGLALVRGLAELHGGRAWLESEYGRGCTAFVILPVKHAGRQPHGQRGRRMTVPKSETARMSLPQAWTIVGLVIIGGAALFYSMVVRDFLPTDLGLHGAAVGGAVLGLWFALASRRLAAAQKAEL